MASVSALTTVSLLGTHLLSLIGFSIFYLLFLVFLCLLLCVVDFAIFSVALKNIIWRINYVFFYSRFYRNVG